MISEHFSQEKMDRILSVMPDFMVAYKVVLVEATGYNALFLSRIIGHFGSFRDFEQTIYETGKKVSYTTYPRHKKLEAGMNRTEEPGFHAMVKMTSAFDWYSSALRDRNYSFALGGSIANDNRDASGFEFEARILKCGIRKSWILGMGYEPEGELVVRCSKMLVPAYPYVNIKEDSQQKYFTQRIPTFMGKPINPTYLSRIQGEYMDMACQVQMQSFSGDDFQQTIESITPVMAEIEK